MSQFYLTFNNPIFYDELHSTNEDRYLIYGLYDNNIIVVSFTVRPNKKYRLITARKAKDWEIEKYYKPYKG